MRAADCEPPRLLRNAAAGRRDRHRLAPNKGKSGATNYRFAKVNGGAAGMKMKTCGLWWHIVRLLAGQSVRCWPACWRWMSLFGRRIFVVRASQLPLACVGRANRLSRWRRMAAAARAFGRLVVILTTVGRARDSSSRLVWPRRTAAGSTSERASKLLRCHLGGARFDR